METRSRKEFTEKIKAGISEGIDALKEDQDSLEGIAVFTLRQKPQEGGGTLETEIVMVIPPEYIPIASQALEQTMKKAVADNLENILENLKARKK